MAEERTVSLLYFTFWCTYSTTLEVLIIKLGNSPQHFVCALNSEEQTESDLLTVSFYKNLGTSACFRRHLLQRKTKFDPWKFLLFFCFILIFLGHFCPRGKGAWRYPYVKHQPRRNNTKNSHNTRKLHALHVVQKYVTRASDFLIFQQWVSGTKRKK